MKRPKDKKTKNKKRVLYCDVRAVSHYCDVFLQIYLYSSFFGGREIFGRVRYLAEAGRERIEV